MFVITLSDIIAIICLVPVIVILVVVGLLNLCFKLDDKFRSRRNKKVGDKNDSDNMC